MNRFAELDKQIREAHQEEQAAQQPYDEQVKHRGEDIIVPVTGGVLLVQYRTPVGESELYYAASILNTLSRAKARMIQALKSAYVTCMDKCDGLQRQLDHAVKQASDAERRVKLLREVQIANGDAYSQTVRERLAQLPVLMHAEGGQDEVAWVNLTAATLTMLEIPAPQMPAAHAEAELIQSQLEAFAADGYRTDAERQVFAMAAQLIDFARAHRTAK